VNGDIKVWSCPSAGGWNEVPVNPDAKGKNAKRHKQ
jgi:hypothetical protein